MIALPAVHEVCSAVPPSTLQRLCLFAARAPYRLPPPPAPAYHAVPRSLGSPLFGMGRGDACLVPPGLSTWDPLIVQSEVRGGQQLQPL